jgi:hypothetical protein
MFPSSSTSIVSAAGTFGRPGMFMRSPVIATTSTLDKDEKAAARAAAFDLIDALSRSVSPIALT